MCQWIRKMRRMIPPWIQKKRTMNQKRKKRNLLIPMFMMSPLTKISMMKKS